MENEPIFKLEKAIDAPLQLVYNAWTQAAHLENWWGSVGFKLTVSKLDVSPGGEFLYAMTADNGMQMWGKFNYLEVNAPYELVYISTFSDADGGLTRHPMSDTWPLKTFCQLSFTERGSGQTQLSLEASPFEATQQEQATFAAAITQIQQGFAGTFTQLQNYLATL